MKDSNEFGKFVGGMLKEARKRARLTQQEVAAKLGCTQGAVAHWESGRKDVGLSTLYDLAKLYNKSVIQFIEPDAYTKNEESIKLLEHRIETRLAAIESELASPKEPCDAPNVVGVLQPKTKPH